jgi:hypothetical protein
MISALVPTWILGASFVALLVVNGIFNGGTSAMSDRGDTPRPGDPVLKRR